MAWWECGTCGRSFASSRARFQHMNAVGHNDLLECDICYEEFPTDEDLVEHEIEDHGYCSWCDRQFFTWNAIHMVREPLVIKSSFHLSLPRV